MLSETRLVRWFSVSIFLFVCRLLSWHWQALKPLSCSSVCSCTSKPLCSRAHLPLSLESVAVNQDAVAGIFDPPPLPLSELARCPRVIPLAAVKRKRAHKAHIMIGILVAADSPPSRELYDRLRAVYNLTRSVDHHIPPLQEWRGVSWFCDMKPCR